MEDDLKRQAMLADFRSYLRGEQPPEVALATAPRLDIWDAVVSRDGKKKLVLRGEVRGHPSLPDGERINTSAVVWLDRKHRWCRTKNRLYKLEGRVVDEGFEL